MNNILRLITGIPTTHKRNSYPANTIRTGQESSYRYDGEITETKSNETTTHKTIDGTVHVVTPRDDTRATIQKDLNQIFWLSLAGMVLSGIGMGVSGSAIAHKNQADTIDLLKLASLCIATTSLGIATIKFGYTTLQAGLELSQWTDPTPAICAQRRNFANDIRGILNHNLRGSVFTAEETQDIFFRTHKKTETSYDIARIGNHSSSTATAIKRFYQTSPLSNPVIRAVFANEDKTITNPKNPNEKYNKKRILDIANYFDNHFVSDFRKIENHFNQQTTNIKNTEELASYGIFSGKQIAKEALHQQKNQELQQANTENERNAIKQKYQDKERTVYMTSILAHGANSMYHTQKKNTVKSDRENSIVGLSPMVEEIFEKFRSARV